MPKLLVILISLSISSATFADQKDFHFRRGNKLFQEGRYEEAVKEYHKILELGYESGEVYYNLGNAYFKMKAIGRAILNYERAKRLLPDDENVRFNLQLANLRVVDKISVPPQFFLFKFFSTFKSLFSLNQLTLIVLILYAGVIGFLILWVFVRKQKTRRLAIFLISLFAIVLLVFSTTLAIRIYENKTRIEAIILAAKVDVRSSPLEEGTELFSLHEGVKVRVEETSGDWVEISLPDGKVGWVKRDVLEII